VTPSISIQDASLAYQNKLVFSNINLHIKAGKWTALLGTSGVGKSSLLRMIAGLAGENEVMTGSITVNNSHPLTKQIAWMAQTDMLLPWQTVQENLLLGYQLRGEAAPSNEQCHSLLTRAHLLAAKSLYPHQLSGGMRQRVALLRTLIENKPIVLMDEPFSALDTITRYQLHELAIELLRDKTVLFVTHDPAEALRLADDIYLLTANSIKHLAALDSNAPRSLAETAALQSEIYAQLLQVAA